MRVLLLSHSGGVGGATRSLQVVARDLAELGAEVSMLAPAGPMHAEWQDDGVSTDQWKPPHCPWLFGAIYTSGLVKFKWILVALVGIMPLRLFKTYALLKTKIRTEKPDYIHINSITLFPLLIILTKLKKKTGVDFKVVWHLREMLNPNLFRPIRNYITKGISKVSETIIAITENEAELFAEAHPVIIFNTIPISWGDEKIEQTSETPLKKEFKVVMAAALSPAKGIEEYFKVAKNVKAIYPEVEFDLFTPRSGPAIKSHFPGDTESENFMNAEFQDISDITFTGGVKWKMGYKISRELYSDYDLYIRPDRAGCPWGRDIIEALWMGLPTIATGTYDGFVKDGKNGYLVGVQNVEEMTQRVVQCIEDRNLLIQLKQNAINFAQEEFSPTTHRKKLAEVFNLN